MSEIASSFTAHEASTEPTIAKTSRIRMTIAISKPGQRYKEKGEMMIEESRKKSVKR